MRIIIAVCIGLAFSSPAPARAGAERAGTTAANFLSVGSGARILGMGGATIGLGGELDAVTWNPGALGWINETQLVLSHAGLESETSQEWMGAGGRFGTLPLHWALSGLYQREGTFDGRDASNNSTGSFGVSSMALGGSLAGHYRAFSAGFGAKWVNDDLGPAMRGSGITFDAGMLVRVGGLGVGVAAQNVGGQMTYGSGRYPFPQNVGAGVSYVHRASGLEADVDVNVPSAYYTNVRAGLEWSFRDHLALRSGYQKELGAESGENLDGPSFGLGLGTHGLWLDYAFLMSGPGDGQHRLGLSVHPGRLGLNDADPFGQKQMPREFGSTPIVGPPVPEKAKGKKKS